MRRPTKFQRGLIESNGLNVPESRAAAGVLTRMIMNHRDDKPDSVLALEIVIREQREQIRELHRLVRYQKLHIAKIQAGEDVPE